MLTWLCSKRSFLISLIQSVLTYAYPTILCFFTLNFLRASTLRFPLLLIRNLYQDLARQLPTWSRQLRLRRSCTLSRERIPAGNSNLENTIREELKQFFGVMLRLLGCDNIVGHATTETR